MSTYLKIKNLVKKNRHYEWIKQNIFRHHLLVKIISIPFTKIHVSGLSLWGKALLYFSNSFKISPFTHAQISINKNAKIRKNCFVLNGDGINISIGNSKLLNTKVEMYGDVRLQVGDDGLIRDSSLYVSDKGSYCIIKNGFDGGDNISITCLEGRGIIFGEGFMCSKGCIFRNSDAHSIINDAGKRINPAEDILIGNHVWMGENVVVLKGVNIGDDVIIGHSAVLTRGLYEGKSAYAGIPGHQILKNVTWIHERI